MADYRKKRKMYRKKRRHYRRKTRIPMSPVPPSTVVKLRYVGHTAIDAGADIAAGYVLAANALYDPNITGVGHQPYGFDQWALFYKRYCVLSSKCTATFFSNSTGNAGNCNVGVGVRDASTIGASDINYWMEQANTSWKQIGQTGGNKAIAKVAKTFSTKRYFNAVRPRDDDQLRAVIGSNPAKIAYYHLLMSASDAASDPPSTNVMFTLEYIAYFDQVAQLAQS